MKVNTNYQYDNVTETAFLLNSILGFSGQLLKDLIGEYDNGNIKREFRGEDEIQKDLEEAVKLAKVLMDGYHVYVIEINGIFYFGKGRNERVFAHFDVLKRTTHAESEVFKLLKEADDKQNIKIYLAGCSLDDNTAHKIEEELISEIDNEKMLNKIGGHKIYNKVHLTKKDIPGGVFNLLQLKCRDRFNLFRIMSIITTEMTHNVAGFNVRSLAEKAGIDKESVSKLVGKLCEMKYLKLFHLSKGRFNSIYRVNMDKVYQPLRCPKLEKFRATINHEHLIDFMKHDAMRHGSLSGPGILIYSYIKNIKTDFSVRDIVDLGICGRSGVYKTLQKMVDAGILHKIDSRTYRISRKQSLDHAAIFYNTSGKAALQRKRHHRERMLHRFRMATWNLPKDITECPRTYRIIEGIRNIVYGKYLENEGYDGISHKLRRNFGRAADLVVHNVIERIDAGDIRGVPDIIALPEIRSRGKREPAAS